MIFINGSGRCGNQLFQFAFARLLINKYGNQKIIYSIEKINKSKSVASNSDQDNNKRYWENSLRYFHCDYIEMDTKFRCLILKYGSFQQIVCYFLWLIGLVFYTYKYAKKGKIEQYKSGLMKMWMRNKNYGLFFYPDDVIKLPETIKHKNIFVSGTFEIASLYNSINTEMKQIYTPLEINVSNEKLFQQITNNNSICVSMRKWAGECEGFQVCDEAYYRKAIKIMSEKVTDPLFVIFSDDVKWAVEWLKGLNIECQILSETGNDDIGEKIRLMSACKHFIISNSTFSWWAQYLGSNPSKIVIGPSKWRPYKYWEYSPIIDERWIKI